MQIGTTELAWIGGGALLGLLLLNRSASSAPRLPGGARQYVPGSPEAIALFEQAADVAGLPRSWARKEGLHYVLDRESSGLVGQPNYTWDHVFGRGFHEPENAHLWPRAWELLRQGEIPARSSATGLGQLKLRKVDAFYPDGRAGIGDPLNEAVGMLRYIEDRYGNPDVVGEYYRLPKCSDIGVNPDLSYYSPRAFEFGCKPGGGY
jgi:hypothetical protein